MLSRGGGFTRTLIKFVFATDSAEEIVQLRSSVTGVHLAIIHLGARTPSWTKSRRSQSQDLLFATWEDGTNSLSRPFSVDDHLITIALGDDNNSVYSVQKAVLCTASSYFTKAFDGSFSESKERTLKLPGCNSTTFELFLYRLCHQKLPEKMYDDDFETCEPCGVQPALVQLWYFADAYLMPKLQNESLCRLHDCFSAGFYVRRMRMATMKLAIEKVPRTSKPWELILDCVARDYSECDDALGTGGDEFLHGQPDILIAITERLRARSRFSGLNRPDLGPCYGYRVAED